MKARAVAVSIIVLFVIIMALTFVQCDHSNMARVTIHIQNDLYTQKSETIIDKLLTIFYKTLYAQVAGWSAATAGLTLNVSGSDIEPIIENISSTAESYTVEVPAGAERTFTLLSSASTGIVETNWGGQTSEYIAPGDNSITIEMIPMTEISGASGSTQLTVTWEGISGVTIDSYNVYRSLNPNGGFTKIGSRASGFTSFDDFNVSFGTVYYYMVSVVGSNGREGLLCEVVSGTPF